MLLFSLLTTLAVVVAGGHRQPFTLHSFQQLSAFTAFNPAQVSRVHAPASVPVFKRQKYQYAPSTPFQPRPAVQFRRTQPVQPIQEIQQRIQPSSGQYQYQGPFNSFGASSTFARASGNIVEQTRAQADSTKALLKSLGNNRKAVEYIDAVIGSNKCFDNLDDAIDAVENAAKLVEKNGPEILSLYEVVEKLEEEKELTKVVTTSAEVLRQLAVLIPSLESEPSTFCNASPEDTIESFSGLAKIIEDVSNANDLQISLGVRQQLKKSSKIISDLTTFLGKLNKSLSSFGQFCGQGKEYQNEFFFAVVPVLEDLAVLFEGFGFAEKANGFRKNGAFIEKLVATFDDLDIDSDVDCGSFTALATVLDELAEVIDSVGVDILSEQLGLDLQFI